MHWAWCLVRRHASATPATPSGCGVPLVCGAWRKDHVARPLLRLLHEKSMRPRPLQSAVRQVSQRLSLLLPSRVSRTRLASRKRSSRKKSARPLPRRRPGYRRRSHPSRHHTPLIRWAWRACCRLTWSCFCARHSRRILSRASEPWNPCLRGSKAGLRRRTRR